MRMVSGLGWLAEHDPSPPHCVPDYLSQSGGTLGAKVRGSHHVRTARDCVSRILPLQRSIREPRLSSGPSRSGRAC